MSNRMNITAVDVGTNEIKVLVGESRGTSFNVIASSSVPSQGFVKGQIVDTLALAAGIRQAVDCISLATNADISQIYLGVSGMSYRAKNVIGTIAPLAKEHITEHDIKRACKASMLAEVDADARVIQTIPCTFYVDDRECSNPLGKAGEKLEVCVHMVSVDRTALSELLDALDVNGVTVLDTFANTVMGASLIDTGDNHCLYLDIGAGLSDLVVFNKRGIIYSDSFPLGGEYITGDIMQAFDVDRQHAEEIKKYYGKLNPNLKGQNIIIDCGDENVKDKIYKYDFLYDVIESRVEEIVTLIAEHIYKKIDSNVKFDTLLFTGGCASMPSMVSCVEKVFNIKPQLFVPQGLDKEYLSPVNTACYGLLRYVHAHPSISKAAAVAPLSLWDKIKNFFR